MAITASPPAHEHGVARQRLYLFGPVRASSRTSDPASPDASNGGTERVIAGTDAQRLLVHLALQPTVRHRREALADVLFPDAASRRPLTDALYRIRAQLGEGWVEADADTIRLHEHVWVDVAEFDRLVGSGIRADRERAIDLYGDELAPGIYDDWIDPHRAARRSDLLMALRETASEQEADGDLSGALVALRRCVVIEPLDEVSHQRYLRVLGRLHRFGEAVTHYESLRKLLADELGVEPLPATTEIVEQLLREREIETTVDVEAPVRFVGRGRERAAAVAAVEAMIAGRGGVWCVEGVAGIGKTRLIGELTKSARWRGATVFAGDVRSTPDASPLEPLARALEPALGTALRVELEAALGPVSLASLAALHRDWSGGGAAASAAPATGSLTYAARVLGETLARLGDVVLVLEDLHWAEATLWDALSALVGGLVEGGGLFVGSYRRPEIESSPGWTVLQAWDRDGMATITQLPPLTHDDITDLIGDPHVSARVLAATSGIPFYVGQWLHAADDSPGDELDLARRRLHGLDAADRAAIEGAAVLGQNVPFRTWARSSTTAAIELAGGAERLARGGWITPTSDGYEFAHELLRTTVYDEIPAARRRTLHGAVADVLAELEPDNPRTLAYHLDRAGRADAAADAYWASGTVQRLHAAFSDAVDSWNRALELMDVARAGDRLTVRLALAEVYDILSEQTRGRQNLDEAIAAARTLDVAPELARALVLFAGVALRSGDTDDAEQALDEADTLIATSDAPLLAAQLHFRRGDLRCHGGRWRDAEHQFAAGLAAAEAVDDAWLSCRLRRGLALCAVRTGRPDDAAGHLEDNLALLRAVGDEANEMVTLTSLFAAYYDLGWWDRLDAASERAEVLARNLGDPVHLGLVCQARSLGALAVGDRERARAEIEEARRWWERAERPWLVSGAINNLGLVADDAGDIAEATACYLGAIERAEALDAATEAAYARHDLGALLWRTGDPQAAITHLEQAAEHWGTTGHPLLHAKSAAALALATWDAGPGTGGQKGADCSRIADEGVALFREGVPIGEHPQGWLWFLAQLLFRLGRVDEANDVVVAAHAELLRQAKHIADDGRRRAFFDDVPLNRAIVAEYRAIDAVNGSTDGRMVVSLARTTAPLGRTLRPDERVEVRWTVRAADDEAIDNAAERRHHRLRRLLREAAEQQAAPTDDDLAAALGVSRRTILRDFDALDVTAGPAPRTRRRG